MPVVKDEHAFLYRIEEFKSLHGEIDASVKRSEETAKYGLLIAAVAYSWLATHVPDNPSLTGKYLYRISWAFPAISTAFGMVLSIQNLFRVRRMGEYLQSIEKIYLGPLGGWETFLRRIPRRWFWIMLAYWIATLAITAAIASYAFQAELTVRATEMPKP